MTGGQLPEAAHHNLNSSGACVSQGTATEGCEAGAENDCGVHQVGLVDDALPQAGHALVHENQNQPVDQVSRRGSGVRGWSERFAVFPGVESRAAFAAELLCRDELLQTSQVRGGAPKLGCDDLAHVGCNIETDDVGQLYRAHGHAKVNGSLVDDGQRDAFLRCKHGLVQVGHQHAVDNEYGCAAAWDWQLVEL